MVYHLHVKSAFWEQLDKCEFAKFQSKSKITNKIEPLDNSFADSWHSNECDQHRNAYHRDKKEQQKKIDK